MESTQNSYYKIIEDEIEIDLRRYILILYQYKVLIVLSIVLTALAAYIVSNLLPPVYESVALVVITKPRYQINFDPRYETVVDSQPPYKAYLDLATSGDVVLTLYEQLDPLPEDITSRGDLAKSIKAKAGSDPSVINLTAGAKSPTEASRIANLWASIFSNKANEIYGDQNQNQLTFFEQQLNAAKIELDRAEEAVIAFKSTDRAAIITTQLNAQLKSQQSFLEEMRNIETHQEMIANLKAQLAAEDTTKPAILADQITTLLFQVNALTSPAANIPLQLMLSNENNLGDSTVQEQTEILTRLASVLDSRYRSIQEELSSLEPEILDAQVQLQILKNENERLTRSYNLTQETYMTLARKLEEARISIQSEGETRVASTAIIPEKPARPKVLINTLIAALVGGFLGILAILTIEFIKNPVEDKMTGSEAPAAMQPKP